MKKYSIILADNPWPFRTWSDKGKGRSPENHYPVLSLEDIKALPVSSMAEDDAVLFLWATSPLLPHCIDTMGRWGFEFKTVAFVWVKSTKVEPRRAFTGLGYYTRSNCEYVLLGTRGRSLSVRSHSVHQVVIAPVAEHSRKPTEVHDRIVGLFGAVTRAELFARTPYPGFDAYGNEIDGRDIRDVLRCNLA